MELTRALDMRPTAVRARIDAASNRLVGSRCDGCGTVSWPSRAVCHCCGEPRMVETEFERAGTLLSYTTVWVERPRIPAPYTLGQVKLNNGPLIFGHVRGLGDDPRVPLSVRTVVAAGEDIFPRFWFQPEEDQ